MEAQLVAIQVLTFASVMLLVIGVRAAVRAESVPAQGSKPALFRIFSSEIEAVGAFLESGAVRVSPAKTNQIRNDLVAAALPLDVTEVRGVQGLGAMTAGALAGVFIFLWSLNTAFACLGLVCCAVLGWVFPVVWVSSLARRRQDAMCRALPYAIDLLTVSMQAGQDFGAALRRVAIEGPRGPLTQEFGILLRQTELGKSRMEALKTMADRIQLDEFRSFVTSVAQSTDMGASIAETMKVQAEEIRRSRYHKAERQAARAPSLMLIPMALFILPSVFIVIFTPVVIRMLDSGIVAYFHR